MVTARAKSIKGLTEYKELAEAGNMYNVRNRDVTVYLFVFHSSMLGMLIDPPILPICEI